MSLQTRLRTSFSRSFETYDAAAREQAWVAARLTNALAAAGASEFGAVLELGCGTGRLTGALRRFPIAALTCNDLLAEAEATAAAHQARFLQGDAGTITLPKGQSLIASASMIQWIEDPARFLARCAEALAPGGWLAISGFGPEQFRELSALGSRAAAPSLTSPENLAAMLPETLTLIEAAEALRPLTFGSPRAVLRHLRATGVNAAAAAPWSKSRLAAFSEAYRTRFGTEEGVPLTYHPTWLIARKAGHRVARRL